MIESHTPLVCEADGHQACACFGRLALRLGLISPVQLRLAQGRRGALSLEESLVRRGDLSPVMAARVNEVLHALGPCRARRSRARTA